MKKPVSFLSMLVFCCTWLVLLSAPVRAQSQTAEQMWAAIAEGKAVAMMRHALAPGGGDPAEFEIGNCASQRNLSDEGRDQARKIGAAFRQNGIARAEVLTSQWCRCAETARLLAIGDVAEFQPLNSFFQNRNLAQPQTEALRDFLKQRTSTEPLVLVTHQVNITAMTGIVPRSGEIVVFTLDQNGDVTVLGQI